LTRPSVDITIPVLNEQRALRSNLSTLASFLSEDCPYDWSITVVDNGSTDQTLSLANAFASDHPRTRVIRLDRPGRGGALKEAWSTSDADVVAYMDVDLSTGLESLRPLLDPILQGEADISIGSRLAPGARIDRSLQREAISRIYNVIARRFLRYEVRDAQCGFKAIRTSLARDLIPRIEDDGWFFDTELLVLAWRDGLRINEIPVRWVEDDDSRVRIIKTALDDLRGIRRLSNVGWSAGSSQHEERSVDFDSYAIRYEEVVDQSLAFTGRGSAFYAERKVEVLGEIVAAGPGPLSKCSVLDVGCGTGTTDQCLFPQVGRLHGVDISEEMLDKARINVPEADFSWYDGEKLPFPDETFDIVIAICVLHHVPVSRRVKFVSEMARVARPRGVVAIFEHNPFNPLTRHAVSSCQLDEDAVLLSAREAAELLKDTAKSPAIRRYFLFSPLGGAVGRVLDRCLHRLPLGGQYVAWVHRSQ
jgi:SAM-dependent methyltransferase/glycosyltransferase involved in cell wall biosynthesis